MPDNLKDWSKYKHLTDTTKQNLAPTDQFSKSKSINQLYQVQEKVIKDAQKSGDPQKIKEADRFAAALHREQRFIRYSK